MQDTVKAELGGSAKISDISKYMAEKWRALGEEDRAKWDEMARKDRKRYEEEVALFPGQIPRPKQRPKKDPNAPKRPMSSFLAFSQKYRGTVRQNDPTVSQKDVSKRLSEMWKDCPEDEKKEFTEQEVKAREIYKGKVLNLQITLIIYEGRGRPNLNIQPSLFLSFVHCPIVWYYPFVLSVLTLHCFHFASLIHVYNTAVKMAEWKKKQAVLEEKKKVERRVERKAESKRRKLEKAKEKRKVQREELDRQQEWYAKAKEAKESGNLSGMGFLAAAAAAEAASTNNPASAAAAAPVPIAAARHPGHPAAALRHAYSQQPGGAVLSAASQVAPFPPSMPMQVDPFSHQALMRAHAAQDGVRAGTIDPESISSADREYLQQALAQGAGLREHLALARAEEEAALAQIRAQFHAQTRMRILAERERRLFLLQQLQGRSGLPGGSAGAHSFLAHPQMAAPHHGAHPGTHNLSAYLTQEIRGDTTGVAAAGAGNAAAPLAEVGVQPTGPTFPTGVIPLQAPSAAVQEASTTENSQAPTSGEEASGAGVATTDVSNADAPQEVGEQPTEPAFPTGIIPVQEASTTENSQAPTSVEEAPASSPHEAGDQHIS